LVGHAAADALIALAQPPHEVRAAIVEREERDAPRDELARQAVGPLGVEDRGAARAVQPDDRALRRAARLVEQAGQTDAVGGVEVDEATGGKLAPLTPPHRGLGRTSRASGSHRHSAWFV